jgi:uncharacterized protein YqgC (DUF456 family)
VYGFQLLYPLSYLLILLGLIGAVVPVLPGSILIWLGIFVWASANGFKTIGWPTLVLLGIMVVITWSSDLLLTTAISRRAGASKKAVLGAIAGGILGGLFLTGVFPVAGTILGGIAGAVIGIVLVETLVRHHLGRAIKSAGGYILGYLASAALQLTLCLLMIGILLMQASAS